MSAVPPDRLAVADVDPAAGLTPEADTAVHEDRAADVDRAAVTAPADGAAADLERLAGDLGAVDEALRRLDDGTYGTCVGCGTALDDAWLAADPTAARCRACGPAPAPPSPPAG